MFEATAGDNRLGRVGDGPIWRLLVVGLLWSGTTAAQDTTPPSSPGPTSSADCAFTQNGTCHVWNADFVVRVTAATDSGGSGILLGGAGGALVGTNALATNAGWPTGCTHTERATFTIPNRNGDKRPLCRASPCCWNCRQSSQ